MKQRYIKIAVVSILALLMVVMLAANIMLFTPCRDAVAHVVFLCDFLIPLRIENFFIWLFVRMATYLPMLLPIPIGIAKKQTLESWGFSSGIPLLRIVAAVDCLLFCLLYAMTDADVQSLVMEYWLS